MHANQITQIQQMEDFKPFISNNILAHVNLNALSIPLNMRKSGFAHKSIRYDSTGHAHVNLFGFKIRRRIVFILFRKLCRSCGPAKFVRIGIQARLTKLIQLLQSLLKLVLWLKFQVSGPISQGGKNEYL